MSRVRNYLNWLHLQWPAGKVDKLPEVNADGTTAVPGVRVVGDLTGVPLLKFSADSGAKAVEAIAAELGNDIGAESGPVDVAIIGAGVAGIAAALEAKKRGLRFAVFEATAAFTTITNFPKAKPIYTYPTDMVPAGDLHFRADVKEDLLAELEQQRSAAGIEYKRVRIERVERRGGELRLHHAGGEPFLAKRVIVAIGRSGNHRKLGVPGEDREHVFNRLHDPAEFAGRDVVVVGGGDSAVEAAVALAQADAKVTLSYRGDALVRAKPENVAALEGSGVRLMLKSQLTAIETDSVTVKPADAAAETVPADAVFALIGREAPLDFSAAAAFRFRVRRRSGAGSVWRRCCSSPFLSTRGRVVGRPRVGSTRRGLRRRCRSRLRTARRSSARWRCRCTRGRFITRCSTARSSCGLASRAFDAGARPMCGGRRSR